MKFIKALFNWKDKNPIELPTAHEKKYSVGYDIHCTDGSVKKNMCVNVPQSELEETGKIVKNDISEMMVELEKAAKKNQTFVEIENNIYRVADVKSITYVQIEMSQILHG